MWLSDQHQSNDKSHASPLLMAEKKQPILAFIVEHWRTTASTSVVEAFLFQFLSRYASQHHLCSNDRLSHMYDLMMHYHLECYLPLVLSDTEWNRGSDPCNPPLRVLMMSDNWVYDELYQKALSVNHNHTHINSPS